MLLSFRDITANPSICTQQPTTAAPPAIPLMPIAIASAALEIGAVKAIPITTEMIIPIKNGCNFVALSINKPSAVIILATGVPTSKARPKATAADNKGTIIISTGVFFLKIKFKISIEPTAHK